jgi:Cysteine-rich CPCC
MDSNAGDRPVIRGPGDDPAITDEELVERRTAWFQAYTAFRNVYAAAGAGPYTCPCCGHRTLSERGSYEICDECGWEDDGQDDHDSAVIRGGPNGRISLDEARTRYERGGGTRGTHVPPGDPQ